MNADKLEKLRIDSQQKKRPSRPFWLILLLVLGITGGAIYYAIPRVSDNVRVNTKSREAASAGSKTALGTQKVGGSSSQPASASTTAPAQSALTVSGYIINRERIELSPRFMGVVNWIGVKKGDSVTNGQVVVLLDDAEYRARLLEIEGRLENARAALEKARITYERLASLAKSNIESKQAEDDARLNMEIAKASIKEITGQHQLMKTYTNWTVIRSPIDGVVLERLVDPNELVTPQSFGGTRGPSTALIAVADPKDLQVEIDLNESDLAKIHLNQKCHVVPEAYPEKSYEGYVAEIAPEANRQKGTLQIKVQIKNPDRYLTPELTARVEFLAGTADAGKPGGR